MSRSTSPFTSRVNASESPIGNENPDEIAKQLDHDEAKAKSKLAVSQVGNRITVGTYAVYWMLAMVSLFSVIGVIVICVHLYNLSSDPAKLENLIIIAFSGISDFVQQYQIAIAGIFAFAFGKSTVTKKKNS